MREERLKKLQPSYFGKPANKKGDQDDAAKKAAEEAAKKVATAKTNGKK